MISSVGLSSATLDVASVQPSAGRAPAGGARCAAPTGDTADISGPGQLFADLKELASDDPEKFKAVVADIAAKLRSASGTTSSTDATGSASSGTATGGSSSRLADLATKFEEAATTGDVSVLAPPSDGGPGGTGGYDRAGRPQGPPPPPPADAANGVDLKSLFDSIHKEVTNALSA